MKANFILWLKAAAVRAVKTLAQTAVATIGTTAMLSEVDWVLVASACAIPPSLRADRPGRLFDGGDARLGDAHPRLFAARTAVHPLFGRARHAGRRKIELLSTN